jgi:hypothetical protein
VRRTTRVLASASQDQWYICPKLAEHRERDVVLVASELQVGDETVNFGIADLFVVRTFDLGEV